MLDDGRVMAILVRFAAILLLAPGLKAQSSTCNYGGAVAGSIFGTLGVVFIILVILWCCYLRKKWFTRRDVVTNQPITGTGVVEVNIDGPEKVDVGVFANLDDKLPPSPTEKLLQIWGIPHVLRKFTDQCEIPHESILSVKMDNATNDPGFTIAQHGVALFVKETQSNSKLAHLKQMNEGMHIIGMSVVFNGWDPKDASKVIGTAAPYKTHLYLREDPLFDVDELLGVPVTKEKADDSEIILKPSTMDCGTQCLPDDVIDGPTVNLEVSSDAEAELMVSTNVKGVCEVPRVRVISENESVTISDEEPGLLPPPHPTWTYERNGEDQKERILSIERPPPPPPRSVSSSSSHDSCWGEHLVPGGGVTGDVYRATPVYLEEADFDLNVDGSGDFNSMPPETKVSATISQPTLVLDTRGDPPRDASSLDSLAVDSGLGSSANVGLNGLHSLSDLSNDGRPGVAGHLDFCDFSGSNGILNNTCSPSKAISISPEDPAFIAEIADDTSSTISHSSSSSRSSIAEAPIERCVNTHKGVVVPKTGLEHLEELSELDRKIALNNIEIATLMLNDSQDRQFFSTARKSFSESEGEEVNEEPIQATAREDDKQSRSIRLSSLDSLVMKNAAILSDKRRRYSKDNSLDQIGFDSDIGDLLEMDDDDDDLSNVIDRLAESTTSDSSIHLRATTDLHYEPDEAYA